jgi:hypothetical protein
METMTRVKTPTNQKQVYKAFSDIYGKLMNQEVSIDIADSAISALSGMNRTFALELKYAELNTQNGVREIEFD